MIVDELTLSKECAVERTAGLVLKQLPGGGGNGMWERIWEGRGMHFRLRAEKALKREGVRGVRAGPAGVAGVWGPVRKTSGEIR